MISYSPGSTEEIKGNSGNPPLTTENCPFTGLPIVQKPHWIDCPITHDMSVSYRFIGSRILHEIPRGSASNVHIEELVSHKEQILAEFFKDKKSEPNGIIEICDFSNITGFPSRSNRLSFIDNLKKNTPLCRGYIAFNISWKLYAVTRLAFKLARTPYPLEIVDNFRDAVEMAALMIRHADICASFNAANLTGSDDWKYSRDGFSVEFKIIKDQVFYACSRGYVKKNHVAKTFSIARRIVEKGYFVSKQPYLVHDLSAVKGASWPARLRFAQMFNALKKRHGNPKAIFIITGNRLAKVEMLLVRKKLGIPMIFVKDLDEALATMRQMEIESTGLPGSKAHPGYLQAESANRQVARNQQLQRVEKYADEIVDFIGSFSWDTPARELHDIAGDHPFKPVFDSLQLVKQDCQELLQESQEAGREAQKANEAKSQFLANITHELRTPLNGILGMTELLLRDNLTAEQIDTLMDIKYSGQTLLDIVNEILDFSKIEAGKIKLACREFAIDRLVQNLAGMLDLEAQGKKLCFHSTLEKDIPSNLRGDPVRLRQILLNLVDNAVKFTREGSIHLKIEKKQENERQVNLRFSIIDTGIGIPAEKVPFLFKRYVDADSSTQRRFSGTGLGLPIARDLVRLMGGSLDFESTPGKGSCFFFEIPFEKGNGQINAHLIAETPPAAGTQNQASKDVPQSKPVVTGTAVPQAGDNVPYLKVLLAEDNLINRKLVDRFLKLKGWQVIHAQNGLEAVRLYREHDVDIILMDIRMPLADGYTAAAQIRQWEAAAGHSDGKHPPHRVPIIALSAHSPEGYKETALASGMDDCLIKPVNPDEMYRVILEHTTGKKKKKG